MSYTRLLMEPGLIAEMNGVEPVLGTITKAPENPLLREDVPWEPRWDDMKPSVWRDPSTGRTHLWYTPFIHDSLTSDAGGEPWKVTGWPPQPAYHVIKPGSYREFALCYAYSDDGVSWHRPSLDRVEFMGSRRNNILLRDPDSHPTSWMRGVIGCGIRCDERETDPARRFKMISAAPHGPGEMGIAVSYSADGFTWQLPHRVLPPEAWNEGRIGWGDTHNAWLYASEIGRYVAFTQSWSTGEGRRRLKLRMESEDFEHWTNPEVSAYSPDVEVHTHVPFRYGNLYLALLHTVTTPDGWGDGTVDVELGVSTDARTWTRFAPGRCLIPRGAPGSMDCGCIFSALEPVVVGDKIRIYYCGNDGTIRGWRRGFWCMATLPRDRWAGYARIPLDPPGEILTRPCPYEGGSLHLNADAVRGSVVVEALADNGAVLARSRRVTGDGAALHVPWETGGLDGRDGASLSLRFRLSGAVLYGFSWGGPAVGGHHR
ncbi:MAG: sialidase family protein [bacterium]